VVVVEGLYGNPPYHDVPYAAAAAVKYIIGTFTKQNF
jgi:hypothetical protein